MSSAPQALSSPTATETTIETTIETRQSLTSRGPPVPVGAAAAVARCLDRDDVEVVSNDDPFAADMRGDVVVDARNLLDPTAVAATGLRYIGVGR